MGIFTLSAIFLVAALQWECDAAIIPVCPPGSSFGEVSPCALTCGNVNNRPVGECPKKPVPGCVCDKGLYAQNGTSGFSVQCVKPEKCKAECDPNEQYQPRARSCPATCENPRLPEVCFPAPIPVCACNEGYLLQGDDCVLPKDCVIKT
ncbi:serine protease inhibitor swm-1-like [Engystomops pustulosus]|uniref:serine protease inhibitor swm-1-like n=1 Tax=Engystomops pustulosus TaxID=76066 RepID=UPI003AFB7952